MNPASKEVKTKNQPTPEILNRIDNVSQVYKAPRLVPETYPGRHPEAKSALLDGESLIDLRWNQHSDSDSTEGDFEPVIDTKDGPLSLDDYLHDKGVPGLAERYALTVFGSNRCPGQLLDKFAKASAQPDSSQEPPHGLDIVPMFGGTLKGYDVVLNAKVGNLGYFFGDLYQGRETADTTVEVTVLFLTEEQLAVIHESEKQYDFKLIGQTRLGGSLEDGQENNGYNIPAFAHVGRAEAYVDIMHSGQPRPLAISEIKSKGRELRDISQTDFQDEYFITDPHGKKREALASISGQPDITPNGESFRDNIKMERAGGRHKLAKRKELQQLLNDATLPLEKLPIDPDSFKNNEKIEPGVQPVPRLGEIAVLNFLEAVSKR